MYSSKHLEHLIEELTKLPSVGQKSAQRLALHLLRVPRDEAVVCVVEQPGDVLAFERTGQFKGRYHVLGGALSPLDGTHPEQLRIQPLLDRLRREPIREVILATNPNVAGEATALYLSRLLAPLGLKVTRIARGVPMGSDLEYSDLVTLARALEGRREVE